MAAFDALGVGALVANLVTHVRAKACGDLSLPCTVTETRTCYVCSPSMAYVDYAREELRLFGLGALGRSLLTPLWWLGRGVIALARLDRQIQINNWLFSTNPPPDVDVRQLGTLKDAIVAEHPGKVVSLRSHGARKDMSAYKLVAGPATRTLTCTITP